MKPVIGSLLAFSVLVCLVLMGTSLPIEAASPTSCGSAVQLPTGSTVIPVGDALMVIYPDGSADAYNCRCIGAGSCSEVGTSAGVECRTTNCGDCAMDITSIL